jgi:hypothetical protein
MEDLIWKAISLVLSFGITALGVHLVKIKKLVEDGKKEIKEIEDIFIVAEKATADNNITVKEMKDILKEIIEAKRGFFVVIEDLFKLFKK